LALTILANALPLIGVLLVGWDIYTLLVYYWCETLVVGFWTVLTIALHRDTNTEGPWRPGYRSKGGAAPALTVTLHAGFFMAGHLFLMNGLYGDEWPGHLDSVQVFVATFLIGQNLWPMLGAAFLQRGLVFWGDYRANSVTPATVALYLRVVVMQLVIIFGSLGVLLAGSGLLGLMLLVAMKTMLDLYSPRLIALASRLFVNR
jgi:hypothetical protein